MIALFRSLYTWSTRLDPERRALLFDVVTVFRTDDSVVGGLRPRRWWWLRSGLLMVALDLALPGLREVPILGILRGCPPEHAALIASGAQSAGLRVIEVTLDSPSSLRQVREVVDLDLDLLVGVGTVTRAVQVAEAAAAGARFAVSPVVDAMVIAACAEAGLPCIPGAATPTEIHAALGAGAAAVKVFPALALGGPAFIAAIAGPLGHPSLIPTGGIDARDVAEYLAAGAVAVGAGSRMFAPEALRSRDIERVRRDVHAWIEAVS